MSIQDTGALPPVKFSVSAESAEFLVDAGADFALYHITHGLLPGWTDERLERDLQMWDAILDCCDQAVIGKRVRSKVMMLVGSLTNECESRKIGVPSVFGLVEKPKKAGK
jgi:hypothetical protein